MSEVESGQRAGGDGRALPFALPERPAIGHVRLSRIGALAMSADRQVLGEDVIWSDDGDRLLLSSHRINARMTHMGSDATIGAATMRGFGVAVIADCLCRENRIVEEWLVRDNGRAVLQLGGDPWTVAQAQAQADREGDQARHAWRAERIAWVRAGADCEVSPDHPAAGPVAMLADAFRADPYGRAVAACSPAVELRWPSMRRGFGRGYLDGFALSAARRRDRRGRHGVRRTRGAASGRRGAGRMSIAAAIDAVVHGRRHSALLENARLETGAGEAFGEEAILSHFARHPLDLSGAVRVETAEGFAAVAGDRALFGDLYDGHVARLWRLDPAAGEPPEAAVGVAFDPDLRQARQDVFARIEDHRGPSPVEFEALVAADRSLLARRVAGEPPPLRARAWLLRALGGREATAGLFATHVVGDEPGGRSAGFVFAAALVGRSGETDLLVRDGAGEARRRVAAWRPRLVP